ncbi:alpha/beta hydrolase [Variovorax sp. HJSM1_2]|uniref:alpha/beta hydrolase n=1 Tax=Variovorax sp. HJSM1_2 TaxID=3366263 RepID=UPI003BE38971
MPSPPAIPPSLRQLMAEVGPIWGSAVQAHVKLMTQEFSAVLRSASRPTCAVSRNIAYGEHARQVLDVYTPEPSQSAAPVLMFVHGGAFVDGDKDRTDEVYSNVCRYFARHGVVGINVEFRLAPESMFPGGTQDMAAAVAWARSQVKAFGGDPERIFLMGHSAGAAHAAHYAYDQAFHPPEGSGLAGLVVVSGRVRSENSAANPNASRVEAYYGKDLDKMNQGSAVNHVGPHCVPTLIAIAEFENPLLDVHCSELFHKLSALRQKAPRFLQLKGHNHTSMVAHFDTAEDTLGREILAFMEGD